MNQNEMIESLRAEIAKLQRVIDLLLDQPSTVQQVRRPGRPKGSSNRPTSFNPEESAPKKRTMSAEGKARIAAAQKKRWAAKKDSAAPATTGKKSAATNRISKAASPKPAGTVALAKTKKSAGARKGTGSGQVASAKRSATSTRKNATKKTVLKRTGNVAKKKPAKQVAAAGGELQASA